MSTDGAAGRRKTELFFAAPGTAEGGTFMAAPDEIDGDEEPEGTPRWVVVMGAITLVLLVAFVIVHLAGGGFHGHGSS